MRQNPLFHPLQPHFGIFTKSHFLPSLRGVEIVLRPEAVLTQHNPSLGSWKLGLSLGRRAVETVFVCQKFMCLFRSLPVATLLIIALLPWSSFPCFFGFPCFFLLHGIPCFLWAFFPSFPGISGVQRREQILVFLVVFLAFSKKRQGKEDQGNWWGFLGFPEFPSDRRVFFYSPENSLKTLQSLGKARKTQKSSPISQENVNQERGTS